MGDRRWSKEIKQQKRQVKQGESRCIRVTLGNLSRGSKRDQREYVWSGRDSIKYGKVILVLILLE